MFLPTIKKSLPLVLLLSGCVSTPPAPIQEAPAQSSLDELWVKNYEMWSRDRNRYQTQIIQTWFKYHADQVAQFSAAKNLDDLKEKAQDAIMTRQAICRDLSEAQHEGVWTRSQCDVWYAQYRISLGKENIAFADAWERLKK